MKRASASPEPMTETASETAPEAALPPEAAPSHETGAPEAVKAADAGEEVTPAVESADRLESILESLLFASDRPLALGDLKRLLGASCAQYDMAEAFGVGRKQRGAVVVVLDEEHLPTGRRQHGGPRSCRFADDHPKR